MEQWTSAQTVVTDVVAQNTDLLCLEQAATVNRRTSISCLGPDYYIKIQQRTNDLVFRALRTHLRCWSRNETKHKGNK